MSVFDVRIKAAGIGTVICWQDGQVTQVSGGYGGWDVVNRPRRKGLTQWTGKDPLRMQMPIIFDGWRRRSSQEIPISRLSRMALPPEGGKGEPPTVQIDGNGLPQPGPEIWVIENLVWGTNVLWEKDRTGTMSRMRQDCIVNLMEYVAEDRLAFQGLATQPTTAQPKNASPQRTQYTVQRGDSLNLIASQLYGDSTAWQPIADANNLRDPGALLEGEVLIIP